MNQYLSFENWSNLIIYTSFYLFIVVAVPRNLSDGIWMSKNEIGFQMEATYQIEAGEIADM